jgi:hypothetical protein
MPAKKAKDLRQWYCRAGDGRVSGPFDTETVRKRVVDGQVLAETAVSDDQTAWRPAAAVAEFGFDCLVLRTDGSIEVLGPFAREYLDRPDVMAGIPGESVFFLRSGTVGEAAADPGAIGKTGAALVERVAEARKALRASENARAKAEAALKAKDLEFDAERQRLAAEISSLKADALKLQGELETMRAESDSHAEGERRGLEAEARLVDAEKELASARAAHERELAAVRAGAEKSAKDSDDEHARVVAELRAAAAEAASRAEGEHAARLAALREEADAVRADADWLRGRLDEIAAEAAKRFARPEPEPEPEPARAEADAEPAQQPEESRPEPEPEPAPVVVEAEPIDEPPPRFRRGRPRAAAPREAPSEKTAPAADKPLSGMAALEDQLQRELRAAAGAAQGAAHDPGSKIMNLFKRK